MALCKIGVSISKPLYQSLAKRLAWNKARFKCMVALIQGILRVRNVNLSTMSTMFDGGDALQTSIYRRFQRFFKEFKLPCTDIANIILSKIPKPAGGYTLCMDRTSWKLGKTHINILTVAILTGNVCVPVAWLVLPKSTKNGNSNCRHRKKVMMELFAVLPVGHIKVLLMDREFLGKEWLGWLDARGIGFVLRLKSNTIVGDKLASELGSTPGPKAQARQDIWDMRLYFGHKKITGNRGKDLFVVSNCFKAKQALELYHGRWGIELLFSHLKRRGFNLEDTHLTDRKKLERLMAVVSLSFLYSYGWGLHLRTIEKQSAFLRRKSDFKYGLDSIMRMLSNPISADGRMPEFLDWVESGCILTNN